MAVETGGTVDADVNGADGAQDADAGDGAQDVSSQLPLKDKLVFDGVEEEHTYESIKRLAQLGKVGQKRMQEAAKIRKEREEFDSKFEQDPIAIMVAKFGAEKTKEMLELSLYKEYQKAKETPEQREAREAKEELNRLKSERQKEQEQREAFRQKQLEDHFAQKFNKEFAEAIKTVGLPHTAWNVARMAELADTALENELDVNPVDIVKMVKEEQESKFQKLVKELPAEQLISYLGSEAVDAIRKANLQKLRQSPVQRRPGTAPRSKGGKPVAKNNLTPEEKWELYKSRLPKEG